MKPLILMTCSHKEEEGDKFPMLKLNTTYTDAILSVGALPLLLPFGATDADVDMYLSMANGLLLTGGLDVEPKLYGEEIKYNTVILSKIRDDAEKLLYAKAKTAGLPIMGICRGMQLINVLEGGTLYQDLPVEKGVIHSDTYHTAKVESGTFFHKLFGDEIYINSYHHQGLKDVAKDFEIICRDGDSIEGISHRELPIFALQYHPEAQRGEKRPEKTTDMQPAFEYFIDKVKKNLK